MKKPAPILEAEYVEAAMEPVAAAVPDSLPDDEPSPEDLALVARVFTPEEMVIGPDDFPYTPLAEMEAFRVATVPCAHCAGSGRVPASSRPSPSPIGPHALDAAPVNSKIVVVLLEGKSHAVLAGPDGAKELPAGDLAHRLPEGARITKKGDGEFLSTQLSPVVDYPPLVTATAGEAIAGFIAHFHPHGLS